MAFQYLDYKIWPQLTDLQILRRSFQFYDKEKQRSIGKKEIFSVMLGLRNVETKLESKGMFYKNIILNGYYCLVLPIITFTKFVNAYQNQMSLTTITYIHKK